MPSKRVKENTFVSSRSISLTIDREFFWKIMTDEAVKVEPSVKKLFKAKDWKAYEEHVKRTFLETPAVALPRSRLIYLYGKIPEDYIEMVITHETLHIVVQKTCGYATHHRPSYDKWVDHPAFNNLLCYQFNMKPSKFHTWLVTKLGKGILSRVFWRLFFIIFGRKKFKVMEEKSKKVWF